MSLKFVILFALFFFFTQTTTAALVTVTTLEDTDDAVCNSQCSLREAIETASPGDTIIFKRELRGGTINLTKTLLIEKNLTIDSPNKRRITVKGNNTFRIFHLKPLTAAKVVSIDGLIIRDGFEANGDGGGIFIDSSTGATLNLTNCWVTNNTALRGGGIFMQGSLTLFVIDSTISNNTGNGEAGAGGIHVLRSTVRMMNSTISNNSSTSTVSGTGGVRLEDSRDWYIHGTTIAFNSANGSAFNSAGGLNPLSGIPGTIRNTIIAKNTGLNPDYYGRTVGTTSILVGITDSSSGFINGTNGNIVGSAKNPVEPQLGALTDNGGGLPTNALLATSPAIDAGNNVFSTDRRGNPLQIDERGFQRLINSTVDIGAYEYNSQLLDTFSTITGQIKNINGRFINGARVVLKDANGEIKSIVTSNPSGYYRFTNIPNGSYEIEFRNKTNILGTESLLAEEATEYLNFTISSK